MAHEEQGALANQTLIGLRDAKMIEWALNDNISPASVDLSLSGEIFEIRHIAVPRHDQETVRDLLEVMEAKSYSLDQTLWKGKRYIAAVKERVRFPELFYGYCNPKSSTGRLDVHTRVIADGTPRFDTVPAGHRRDIWVVIEPKSFSIKAHEGDCLTQLRVFNGDTRFDEVDLTIQFAQHKLAWKAEGKTPYELEELVRHDKDGSLMLTLDMPEEGIFGYRCVAEQEDVLDLHERNVDPRDFFKAVRVKDGSAWLRRGRFYILSSAEHIRIPPHLAAEMVPMDDRSGEFRSHYAGFLDPGWGWGEDGEGTGRPFTLEVRPFEDLLIRPGNTVAKIRFERMREVPKVQYDSSQKSSNYVEQFGPKLAKQFAAWPS